MDIYTAIEASEYDQAATEMAGNEALVSADAPDGLYELQIVTSTGDRLVSEFVTLRDIRERFATYEWWPIRENGEYGPEIG